MTMRRKDKEITDISAIESILARASVCRIAMCSGNSPYIVPVNYSYGNGFMYIHSFPEGKKIDMIRNNPKVCFEADVDAEIVMSEKACDFGMKYKSVIGYGDAEIVENVAEKRKALGLIMKKYSGKDGWDFGSSVDDISVIKIHVSEMSGKRSG